VVNISVVRNALAAQVSALAFPALRMLADVEDQINPPVGIVMPGRPYASYATTLEGADGFGGVLGGQGQAFAAAPTDFNLDIVIVLAKASTIERVEANLDAWLGFENDGTAVSVPAAVMSDITLGKTVSWCIPVSAEPPGPIEWNAVQYFGARIHFQLSAL
jgi:hypothetical protein